MIHIICKHEEVAGDLSNDPVKYLLANCTPPLTTVIQQEKTCWEVVLCVLSLLLLTKHGIANHLFCSIAACWCISDASDLIILVQFCNLYNIYLSELNPCPAYHVSCRTEASWGTHLSIMWPVIEPMGIASGLFQYVSFEKPMGIV